MFNKHQIAQDTIAGVLRRYQEMARHLYHVGTLDDPVQPLVDSPLRQRIELLVDVANNHAHHESEVHEALMALSNAIEGVPAHYLHPHTAQVIQRVQLWLHRDELITLSEAAQMLRGAAEPADLMYVRRLIDRGDLAEYTDPDEPNPRRNGRVGRKQVERVRDAAG